MTPYQSYVASTPYDVLIAAGIPDDHVAIMRLAHFNKCRGDIRFKDLPLDSSLIHASLRARASEAVRRQGPLRAAWQHYYRLRRFVRLRGITDAELLRKELDSIAVPCRATVEAAALLTETREERRARLLAHPVPDWRRAHSSHKARLKVEAAEARVLHAERDRLQRRTMATLSKQLVTPEIAEMMRKQRMARTWEERVTEDMLALAQQDRRVLCARPTQPVELLFRRHQVRS